MSTATASERFWPATFAERGATVPFTTPLAILGALSLAAGVVGTLAAAAALRWGE